MSDADAHDPDKSYTLFISYPYAQIRVEIGLNRGDVQWFRVQLEYNVDSQPYTDNDWRQVAGFDHHPNVNWGHDITIERLHLDIYRDGRKEDVQQGFPEIELNKAPAYCENFLRARADTLLNRFGRWHGIEIGEAID